eukprot:6196869-Pleurochrysis_carterae.AAC.3
MGCSSSTGKNAPITLNIDEIVAPPPPVTQVSSGSTVTNLSSTKTSRGDLLEQRPRMRVLRNAKSDGALLRKRVPLSESKKVHRARSIAADPPRSKPQVFGLVMELDCKELKSQLRRETSRRRELERHVASLQEKRKAATSHAIALALVSVINVWSSAGNQACFITDVAACCPKYVMFWQEHKRAG